MAVESETDAAEQGNTRDPLPEHMKVKMDAFKFISFPKVLSVNDEAWWLDTLFGTLLTTNFHNTSSYWADGLSFYVLTQASILEIKELLQSQTEVWSPFAFLRLHCKFFVTVFYPFTVGPPLSWRVWSAE